MAQQEVTDPELLAILNGSTAQASSSAPPPFIPGTPRPEKPREAPSGYNWGPNGTLIPIKGGPADDSADKSQLTNEQKGAIAAEAMQKLKLAQSLDKRSREGWFATGFGAGTVANAFPASTAGDVSADVDTLAAAGALQRIMEMAQANGGKNPLTPLSNADFIALGQSISSLKPTQSDPNFQKNLKVYADIYLRALQAVGGDTGALDKETQDYLGISAAPSSTIGGGNPTAAAPPAKAIGDVQGGGQAQLATGTMRREIDQNLTAQADAMIKQGAPLSQINRLLSENGGEPISQRDYGNMRGWLKNWERRNPGKQYGDTVVQVNRFIPQTAYEQAASTIGGNPAGAYVMGAGQFLSGNTLDNMQDDPERARMAQQIVQSQSPNAFTAGEISGGVMGSLLGEAGLARAGFANPLARGMVADTAMGAANGAGMADDGSRLGGAVQGGGLALAGNLTGNALTRGAARVVSPSGGGMNALYDAGVTPTVGQRMAGKGVVGNAVNNTEQALQSVPFVGSAIRGARQEARDQFQIGAFNEALKEVGEQLPKGMKPGTDPHKYAQKTFERVYAEARGAMAMQADDELAQDLSALSPDIATLGEASQKKLKAIMANQVNNRLVNGAMDGAAYKKTVSDLGKRISQFRNSSMAEDQMLADVLEGVRGAIDNAARRHSDPDAVKLLDAADAGYARLVRIEEAGARVGGDAGTFTPKGFGRAVQKTSGGVRSKAYQRGDALMQDYADAGRGLDDTLPNSGTTDRLMVGGGAAAAGFMEPTTLAILGAIGAAYAPGVRKVQQAALKPGGPKSKAIADQLRKISRAASATSAAAAPALSGTSPGQ